MQRTITVRQAVAGAVAVVLLSTLGAAAATAGVSQTFTDVGPSNPFYDDIEAIAGAGITEGYPDGTYRPGANVTRQAMAAFMGRGFGRVAYDDGIDVPFAYEDPPAATVAQVMVQAGASGTGGGYVALSGSMSVTPQTLDDAESCPCQIQASLRRVGSAPSPLLPVATVPGLSGGEASPPEVPIVIDWVVPIEAGATDTYVLAVFVPTELEEGTDFFASGSLTATYVPFPGIAQPEPPTD